ncbi:MAG: SDR family NAD(P)-dependent oxidoreductase [Spirochaetia bacterium]|nr:SDR family NAD(P)-dependent oxidoreductase [Spirochaetia bacterium]
MKNEELLWGNRLSGRTAVVTGAASGIGRAIALRFAEEGAESSGIVDITTEVKEGGKATAELIQSAGGTAVFCKTDAPKWDDINAMVEVAVEQFGS